MSREMEYDADRYESLVAGSGKSREISENMRYLMVGKHQSEQLWRSTWNDNRLPDNLPQMVALLSDRLTEEQKRKIAEDMTQRQTEVWDTHPADNDRIARAEASQYPGIWLHDFPAARLMPAFDALCKTVSLRDYNLQGLKGIETAITHTADILDLDEKQRAVEVAVEDYLQGTYSQRVVKLQDRAYKSVSLAEARTHYQQSLERIKALLEMYSKATEECQTARQAMAYLEAGFAVNPEGFGLKAGTLDAAQAKFRQQSQEQKNLAERLQATMDKALNNRIAAAIDHMSSEAMSQAVGLRNTLIELQKINDTWQELPGLTHALLSLLREQDQEEVPPEVDTAVSRYTQYGRELLMQFGNVAGSIEVRLGTQEHQTLLSLATRWDVDLHDIGALGPISIYQLLDGCYRVICFVTYRALGELAALCQAVEVAQNITGYSVSMGSESQGRSHQSSEKACNLTMAGDSN